MEKYPHLQDEEISLLTQKNVNNSLIKKFKNPEISHINKDSHFIYDESSALLYYNKITNKNLIKPSIKEISLLQNIINEITTQKLLSNPKQNLIEIPATYFEKILYYTPKITDENNELIDFVKNELQSHKQRQGISCRKLALLYEKKFKKKIGKTTIHKILRKKLNFRYLKTTYKTNKIEFNNNKIYAFFFIKAVAKCINLNFELIFLDESKIEIHNNHFKCWRYKGEEVLFGSKNNYKKNLILSISKSEIVYYELSDENTNSEVFLGYIKKLKKKLDDKNLQNYIIILDNCKVHKSKNVLEFLISNKINILFTPSYLSTFTPIELAFRSLKKLTYSKLYSNMNELINDIKLFLENQNTKKTLFYNYKETIQQYISYYDLNKNINLNNFDI